MNRRDLSGSKIGDPSPIFLRELDEKVGGWGRRFTKKPPEDPGVGNIAGLLLSESQLRATRAFH